MKYFRRRSKTFALPALAAAMPWITAGGTIIGAGTGIKGAMDSSEANELQRQMNKQQAVNDYKAQALEQKKIEATNKLANSIQQNPSAVNNPALSNASMAVGQDLTTKAYSTTQFKRKNFGLIGNLIGFTKTPIATNMNELRKTTMEIASSPITAGMSAFQAGQGAMAVGASSKNLSNLKSQLSAMKTQTADLESQTNDFVNSLNTATKSYSDTTDTTNQTNIKFRQKDFGLVSNLGRSWYKSGVGKFVNGLGKVTGDMIYDHRNKIIGGTLAGAGMAAVHYGVNKGIQHNMKKNGIDMEAIRDMQKEQQQQYGSNGYANNTSPQPQRPVAAPRQQFYAEPAATTNGPTPFNFDSKLHQRNVVHDKFGNPTHYEYVTKEVKDAAGNITQAGGRRVAKQALSGGSLGKELLKEHLTGPMPMLMTAAFEIPTVTGYMQEKNNLKALSDMARARKGLAPLPARKAPPNQQPTQTTQQPQPGQRMYGAVGHWISNKIRGFNTGFNQFKKAPGQWTLNKIDTGMLGGGQGLKGVENFGNRFINYGKQYNSQALQKTGEFIKKNPKLTMAASTAAAFYTMGKTMNLGENLVNKPLKAIDPGAYAYDEYKEQQL